MRWRIACLNYARNKEKSMEGTLVYVMGPSGSGKDSLLSYARRAASAAYALTWDSAASARHGRRPILFVRRHITRPLEVRAGSGAERHLPLTREAFQRRKALGEFSLSWESHGLCYGIGREIDARLAEGALVIVNGSREYLPEALKRYPELVPVLISVRPEVLRARLEKRGREKAADINERLAKAAMTLPDIPSLVTLDNSGPLEEAGRRFVDLCNRLRRASFT